MRVAHERAAVLRAEAAGDDDLAVLRERLADRVERLGDGESMNPQVLTTTSSASSYFGAIA
jgi:hypothetical protein